MKTVTPKTMPTIVSGVREIEGVKFHITGSEFIETLEKRAKEHLVKAKEASDSLKTADDALQVAQNAAAKAGKSSRGSRQDEYSASLIGAARKTPSRAYGGSMENPVEALREAVNYHYSRASTLKFYAKHLLNAVVYVLSEHDVTHYELLELAEEEN